MTRTLRVLCGLYLIACLTLPTARAQSNQQPSAASSAAEEAHKIPVMDGAAGPCALDLTVTSADGKPIYAATIKVHIAYGFAGARRLDLQAATNIDGKVKFTGIPAKVKRPPLEFEATKDKLEGMVTYNPESECHAHHDLTLAEPKAEEEKP